MATPTTTQKTTKSPVLAPKVVKKVVLKDYIEGIGRRKTSIARVRIAPAPKNSYVINDREFADYFPTPELQSVVESPFVTVEGAPTFAVTVVVKGGGIHSQAEAVRHGISRAMTKSTESYRPELKKAGFLSRDPRAVERKHFGLKKARKASQWSKR